MTYYAHIVDMPMPAELYDAVHKEMISRTDGKVDGLLVHVGRQTEDGFDLDGELTIHGVTRPVTLALDVNGFTKDPYGNTRAGFSATGEIDRTDFGVDWNAELPSGGQVLANEVKLTAELELVQQA